MLFVKCLLWLQFMHFLNANEPRQIIYWESYQPGQLLHSLKQLTSDIDLQPMQQNVSIRRMDNVVAASSHYDYDRAYDDFVRKYFSDAVNSAFSQENNGSVEEDALTEASRTSQRKKQQCKQVRKNREICKICRNESTGEKSETCSYASESVPRDYAYQKARNYKKSRQTSVENSDEQDDDVEDYDDDDDEQEAATTRKESGSCTRLQKHGKVCYFCINSVGEKIKECTKLTNTSKRRTGDKNDKLKKSQRIYKRTVSFVSENMNTNTNNNNNTVGNTDKTELNVREAEKVFKAPHLRKKFIIKVLKKKKTMN